MFDLSLFCLIHLKVGIYDAHMKRKLAILSLRGGVGSMDYIHSRPIMEDALNDEPSPDRMCCPWNVTPLMKLQLCISHQNQVPLEANKWLIGAYVNCRPMPR